MLEVLLELNEQVSVFLTLFNAIQVASTCKSTLDKFKWYQENMYDFGEWNRRTVGQAWDVHKVKHLLSYMPVENITSFSFADIITSRDDVYGVDEKWVQTLAILCPHLQSLDMGFCFNTTEALKSVSKNCLGLTSLNLKFCRLLSDTALASVLEKCSKIQSLILEFTPGVTDSTMSVIAKLCPRLTSIDVADCHDLTRTGLQTLLSQCSQMRILRRDMMSGQWMDALDKSSDGTLAVLSTHCPHLEDLDIGSTHVSGASVWGLSRGCTRLQRVCLSDCVFVEIDEAMRALALNCTALQVLDLSYCDDVVDSTLEELSGCSELVRLNLMNCCNFSTDWRLCLVAND